MERMRDAGTGERHNQRQSERDSSLRAERRMKIFSRRMEKAKRRGAAALQNKPPALVASSMLLIVLLSAVCTPVAAGQTASDKQGSKGRKQTVSNPLNDLLEEARRDIDKEDFQAAVLQLQKFLAEKDDFAYAHFQLGYAYTALQKTEEARVEYERAMQLDPKMAEAALNLGILLSNSEPSKAIAPLQKAVELLATQSRPRTLLALAYEKTGDTKRAEESYEAALALDPRDTETSLHLAQLYLGGNRAADAEVKFRTVLAADPKSQAAMIGLAESLEAEKKPEAADAYRNILAERPDDAAARAHLIHLLVANEQYDDALAEMARAEKGGAPSVESLKLRADILIGQKKWNDAIAVLKQAVTLAPNDAQLHGGLGRTYLQVRDFPNAANELKAALRLEPKNVTFWKDLTSVSYLAGDYATTLSLLDHLAQMEQPTAAEWFVRALCYDKLQQTKAALEAYQKFLDADQNRNPDQVWQAQQRISVLKRRDEKR